MSVAPRLPVQSYRDLIAWRQSMELVTVIYRETRRFPENERFGLTSQLRRSAVSIPSNIAEGQGRYSTGEFRQFLGHARGSLLELQTQVSIAENLGYFSPEQSNTLADRAAEIGRILNGLINSLKNRRALRLGDH